MEALKKSSDQPTATSPLSNSRVNSFRRESEAALWSRVDIVPEPAAPRRPQSLLKMPDEILEFYAFIFCQRGFRALGMTFEQFLEVIEAVRPQEMRTSRI